MKKTERPVTELSDQDLEGVSGGKAAGVLAVETLLFPLPQIARQRASQSGGAGGC